MSETPTVRALLDVEDAADEVLFANVPGSEASLWPLARWPISAALSAQHLGVVAVPSQVPTPNKIASLRRRVSSRLLQRAAADRLQRETEFLFIGSGTTRAATNKGVGNWLFDGFAAALGNRAAVIQDASIEPLTPRRERPLNPHTWSWAPVAHRIKQSTWDDPPSAADTKRTRQLIDEMLLLFDDSITGEFRERVVTEVSYRARFLKHTQLEFEALLDRTKPRRIFMQAAAYGDRSNLIRVAHARGIEVIELQHGWIGASHAAYNFGAALRGTALTASLPDTLYTFGEYWGEQLRFPGRVVPIGKPELSQSAITADTYDERPMRVLLVSSDYEYQKLATAARTMRQSLPSSWSVVLRPHPQQRPRAEKLFADELALGIELDADQEASASIKMSRAVVGMVSTMLYEALALGVHIGVLETDLARHYSATDIFPTRLRDPKSSEEFSEFVKLVRSGAPLHPMADDVWHPNPVENFLALNGE